MRGGFFFCHHDVPVTVPACHLSRQGSYDGVTVELPLPGWAGRSLSGSVGKSNVCVGGQVAGQCEMMCAWSQLPGLWLPYLG